MKLPSRDVIRCELARRSYAEYVDYVHKGMWVRAEFPMWLANTTQDFLEDNLKDEQGNPIHKNILVISVPPQHSKSMTVTESLASWYMGKYPTKRIIMASYNSVVASKFGRKNRYKIQEFGEKIFGLKLARANDTFIEADNGIGYILSVGFMGGITSYSGDLMLIDDPVKNRQEAESETYRERMKAEWRDTFLTRFQSDTKIILIQTRWHEDDLAGFVIKNNPQDVYVINIPAEAEENDVLGREPGDALLPEIGKNKEWLKSHKKNYIDSEGLRSWNSLYQGRPSGKEGTMFKRKWFNFVKKEELPGIEYYNGKVVDYFAGMEYLIMSVDATFKDGDDNDKVAIGVLGKRENQYYVCKVLAERMDFTTTLDAIRVTKAYFPNIQGIFIEDKANGSAIMNVLRKELDGIVGVEPYGGKKARAYAVQPVCRAEQVNIVVEDWTEPFMHEMTSFPNGKHDDQVDMFTQGINQLIYYHSEIVLPPKRDDFADIMRMQDNSFREEQEIVISPGDFTFD